MLSLRKGFGLIAIPVALALTTSSSLAANSAPTLFGDATYNAAGVQLTTNGPNGYSGIDIPLPAGTTVADLSSLDAKYSMTTGDCSLGSPRYGISLPGNNQNIFAYFGQYPSYTNCANGVQYQSNVLQPKVDTSQLPGGTFYDTWAHAQSVYGSQPITDLFVVADAPNQVIQIYSLSVNGKVYNFAAPTSKEQCKKGGWATFINPGTFKNQGDCVSYFATNGKNGPNG